MFVLKKKLPALLAACICFMLPFQAFAATAQLQKRLLFVNVDNAGLEAMQAGKVVTVDAYNVSGYTYYQLRDIALILNGENAAFNVVWNSKENLIEIKSGENYTANGTELKLDWLNPNKSYEVTAQAVDMKVNGHNLTLPAYNIEGFTYFQLRDLGTLLGFGVNWLEDEGAIQILTD